MTPREQFVARVARVGGGIEARRWTLARLALDAKRKGWGDWAELVGNAPNVRRAASTVYEWVQTYVFAKEISAELRISRISGMTFSHWTHLMRCRNRLSGEQLVDVIRQTIMDDLTLEQLRALTGIAADAPDWSNLIDKEMSRLVMLSQRPECNGARPHLEAAIEALRQARESNR